MADEKIKAVMIFEMMGRPADHLKDTIIKFIESLDKEKDMQVLNKKISEPKKLEESKQELFTTFAETEIEFENVTKLFAIFFGYMPSNIEIVEPVEFKMKNFEFSTLANELTRKLHQYDEIVKRIAAENTILKKKLQEINRENDMQINQDMEVTTNIKPKEESSETNKKVEKKD